MASRPLLGPYPVITNGNMASSITSAVTLIPNTSMISYSITWSGSSPSGTVTVQVSNDYSINAAGTVLNAGTWNTLPMSATGTVSGNTGNGFADIDTLGGYAIRLVYTPVSGTGTMNAIVTGKVQ